MNARIRAISFAAMMVAFALSLTFRSPNRTAQNASLIDAIRTGDLIWVEQLLREGADPNAASTDGRPAITGITDAPVTVTVHGMGRDGLEHRIEKHKNHRAIVELLIKKGANVNVSDAQGWTPLEQANASDEIELVAFLRAAGAKK